MRDEQYRLAARRAINSSEHETSMLVDVHHNGNLVLYLFLEYVLLVPIKKKVTFALCPS
jgi:hypothetical protein